MWGTSPRSISFHQHGLADVAVEMVTGVFTELPTVRAILALDALLERAQEARVLTGAEARDWLASLEAADRVGCFLMSAGGFLVSGRKP